MAATQLLVTAASSLIAVACFLGTALALRRRRYSPELRWAGQAYVLWWLMLGFQALTDAARILLGLQDPVNVDAYVWLARLKIIAAGVGIWALGRYVIFLRSGRQWYSFPLAAFAAAHAAFFLMGVQAGLPAEVTVDTWSPRLLLHGPGLGVGVQGPLTLFFFFLPPIALALAYLALVRRVETRTQRARLVSIAVSILVFQAVGAIQFNPNTPANSPAFAILPLVSAVVALIVLATYRPPKWVARRFGIEGVADEREIQGSPAMVAPGGKPR